MQMGKTWSCYYVAIILGLILILWNHVVTYQYLWFKKSIIYLDHTKRELTPSKLWPLTRKRTLTVIRSTAKRSASERMKNGWPSRLKRFPWTAERPKKNFERLAVNGWTAKEKFRTACGERLNGQRKISNGWLWTAERPKKNFERLAVNGWTAMKNLRTACGERVNGHPKISNG